MSVTRPRVYSETPEAFLKRVCEDKRSYRSMRHAVIAMGRLNAHAAKKKRVHAEGMVPYRCKFCGNIHLGHP